MTVRLYDSKAQAVTDLVPINDGEVGMYVCGPTVQSSPHIGHLRSALVYDLWRRWLSYRGYDVTLVRNVTDIDDKILAAAGGRRHAAGDRTGNAGHNSDASGGHVGHNSGSGGHGEHSDVSGENAGHSDASGENAGHSDASGENAGHEEWWALAYRVELEFTAGYSRLGIQPPTYEPRATASIGEMQRIIQVLIERGHAYAADGDVYFDTASWPSYGELTRQKPADMEAATDADPRAKRDPRDFALWKGRKATEPESASWPSPWGAGRPGWHIECSAMAHRYLGSAFDIHGGGLDLRFPHHENELAQSTAAGDAFAKYWVHNGLVNVNGQKMSKSLGNSIFAAEFFDLAPAIVVRYFLGAAHYRSTIDYHDGALVEAQAALDRIEVFLTRAGRSLAGAAQVTIERIPDEFAHAMDDDLAVPQALGVLHERVRVGNAALDAGDLAVAASARGEVLAMVELLGINPHSPHWRAGASEPSERALASLVESLITGRNAARAAKDFAAADRIRDELAAAGISVEDGATGSHWSVQ